MRKRTAHAEYINKQHGSATVEAAIVIPLLMIVIISLLSIIRIISIYSRVQHALNQVAAEMSQYSYIYVVSGLKQYHDGFVETTKTAWEELQNQTQVIEDFYKSVQAVYGEAVLSEKEEKSIEERFASLISELENMQGTANNLIETVDAIMEDPIQEVRLIGLALSDTLLSKAKTALFGAIAKNMLTNKLKEDLKTSSTEKLEKVLLLKGGIERLDFTASTFFNDGETIDIIVEYTVTPGFPIIPEVRLRNRACILSWAWGVGRDAAAVTPVEKESLWNLDKKKDPTLQHLARGNKIDRLFAYELKKKIGEYAEITPENFKTIDVVEYAHDGKDGSLIMIFSLNPFLPTYSSKSAVIGTIKQNLNKLSTFQRYQVRDYILDVSLLSGNYKRVAYIIIPENEMLPEPYIQAFEECRVLAEKMGIELYQVQKYGEYDNHAEENE